MKKCGYHIAWIMLIILGFSPGCVEPYEFDNGDQTYYVIDGILTNQGTSVTISLSSDYSNDPAPPVRISAESVVVVDENGNQFPYSKDQNLIYRSSLSPEAGIHYQLQIQINGELFTSTFEQMPNRSSYELVANETEKIITNSQNESVFVNGVLISAIVRTNEVKENLKWEYLQYEDLSVIPKRFDTSFILQEVPADADSAVMDIGFWPYTYYIASDVTDSPTKIQIVVNQYSINDEAFDYWQLIRRQLDNSGGIFDTQPSVVESNITSTTSQTKVLGRFHTSNVNTQSIIIRKN